MAKRKKLPLLDSMYFVYTLSHNGQLFYIGCTKDILLRYQQHLNKSTNKLIRAKIAEILAAGQMPVLNVLTYTNKNHAFNIEEVLLKCLTIGGHKVLNSNFVRESNEETPCDFSNHAAAIKSVLNARNYYVEGAKRGGWYYKIPLIAGLEK